MSINPALVDVILPEFTGFIDEHLSRDELCAATREAGAVVTDFPTSLWIEPKDWPDAARDNDKYRRWGLDFLDRFTNQDPTHECTCHCLRACMEACYNRARAIALGPPVAKQRLEISAKSASVWLSPLSVYAEANPRKTGGAGVRQVLQIAARRGMLPELIQPRDYKFKHAMQGTTGRGGINASTGPWLPVSKFPPGWEATAANFKPLEFVFPETWEQHICLLLHGYCVGVGRSGHSVPHAKYMIDDQVAPYPDSYDVIRFDSLRAIKSTVGGSYAVISTTVPNDWNNPAEIAA